MRFQDWLGDLSRYELPLLTLITFAAMASQPLLLVAVALSLVFALLHAIDRRAPDGQRWIGSPVDWSLRLLLLMLPVSWWVSIDRANTGWQILRLLNGIGLFYAVLRWRRVNPAPSQLQNLIIGLEGVGFALCGLGLVSTKWPIGKSSTFDQIYHLLLPFSTGTIHPNVLAGSVVLLLPIALVFWLFAIQQRQSWRWLLWHSVSALTIGGTLVLTQSRGAALGSLATLLVLIFCLGGKRIRLGIGVSFTLVALIASLFPSPATQLLSQLTSDSAISTGAVRLEIWSRAYYMIQDFPFTGIGMGNFQRTHELLYPLLLTSEVIPHAHNLLLQIAVDLGLVGLISWLALNIGIIAKLVMTLKEKRTTVLVTYFAIALLGSQAALLVHGAVDAVLWGGVRTAPLLWLLWGAAVGTSHYFPPQTQ